MRLSDFQDKEVINGCDCRKLGCVTDLIFDERQGYIEAVIIPKNGRWYSIFGDCGEYIIPFSCIQKIGPDIILVEMHEENQR